jgi:hypothetical protein
MNENVAHTKVINCTNVIEIKNTERHLFKIRCKRENTVSKNAALTIAEKLRKLLASRGRIVTVRTRSSSNETERV